MNKQEIKKDPKKIKLKTTDKPYKRENKNAPEIKNFNQIAFQYFEGIDLMAIEGVSHATVMSIMSEIGLEGFKKFSTSKEFCSWLRLAPNNRISGGKVLSSKIPKGSNRLKIAFRQAANAIGNLKDTHLSDFFKRIGQVFLPHNNLAPLHRRQIFPSVGGRTNFFSLKI